MLKGVEKHAFGYTSQSMVMRSKTGTVRVISAQHDSRRKPTL